MFCISGWIYTQYWCCWRNCIKSDDEAHGYFGSGHLRGSESSTNSFCTISQTTPSARAKPKSSLFLGCLNPWSNTIGKLIFPQQFQRNSQNPVSLGSLFRSFLMNLFAELEWILSATWTVDCKSPLLSQEGQEMHNQLQEKQILYFKLPWYWLHLYWNSGYVHLRVTFTSLAWLS